MYKKLKKKLTFISVGLATLLVLFGCSGENTSEETTSSQEASSGQGEEPVELTFWYAFGDAVEQNNKELTEKFNETIGAEEGIHVTAEYQGDYNDIYSKLQSGFVAGEAPNVSVINSLGVIQFAKNEMLEPIDGMIEEETMEDFYPGLLLNSYYEDDQYGVPYLRSTPLMYYNKTMLEEAGVDTSKLETYDDVRAASDAVKEKLGKPGLGFVADQWQFDALLRQNDSGIMNEEMTEAIFANEQSVETFEDLRSGINDEAYTFFNNSTDQTTAIANQEIGLWFMSTGSLANMLKVAEESGFEVGTAFMPTNTGDRNVPTGGANIVMVGGQSEEEKEASAIFMNFMTSQDSAAHSHITTGYLPTRQSLAEHPDVVELYEEHPQYQTALDQLDYAGMEPNAPGYLEVVTNVDNMITEIVTTDVDIMETLQSYEDASNSVLEAER